MSLCAPFCASCRNGWCCHSAACDTDARLTTPGWRRWDDAACAGCVRCGRCSVCAGGSDKHPNFTLLWDAVSWLGKLGRRGARHDHAPGAVCAASAGGATAARVTSRAMFSTELSRTPPTGWVWRTQQTAARLCVPIRLLGLRRASGTHVRWPGILPARPPHERRRGCIAGVRLTCALLAECVPTLGVSCRLALVARVGISRGQCAQGACRCVCACVVCRCPGTRCGA